MPHVLRAAITQIIKCTGISGKLHKIAGVALFGPAAIGANGRAWF